MFDLAIVGSGFAGSLMAMIAQRLGRSVLLIERGRHPRFAIGESSTPLANLLLEELATRYDLPMLLPLTKWGTWQRAHPEIACGLKRGFSFFHHRTAEPWTGDPDHEDQLLVGASPNEEIADTHWYRAEFDEFFAHTAADLGVTYVEEMELDELSNTGSGIHLGGARHGSRTGFAARFLFDATGPRAFLHRALKIPEVPMPNLPETEGLYAHFSGVRRFADTAPEAFEGTPYAIDDAAVHHVFEGGWVWVLRFNNGLTSAGVAATRSRARVWSLERGEPAWTQILQEFPSVGLQFHAARAVTPFHHSARLAYRSGCWAGERWCQLPSASGFIDPLLSTGFPLTLLGIHRMAEAINEDWGTNRFAFRVREISLQNEADFLAAEQLVAALYAQMHDFPIFRALTLLYFAAASFNESARRLGRVDLKQGFLLREDPQFGKGLTELCSRAISGINSADRRRFIDEITAFIEPINVAGLGRKDRRHWYPADPRDLLDSAAKLGASRADVTEMLRRVMACPVT
jgi:FADH2 O2-dependent halogenase